MSNATEFTRPNGTTSLFTTKGPRRTLNRRGWIAPNAITLIKNSNIYHEPIVADKRKRGILHRLHRSRKLLTVSFTIRCTPAEKELFGELAFREGLSKSEWGRKWLNIAKQLTPAQIQLLCQTCAVTANQGGGLTQ